MKTLTKVLCLLLVAASCFGLASCGGGSSKSTTAAGTDATAAATRAPFSTLDLAGKDHADISDIMYDAILGEFYEYYQKAQDAANVSERYALMAIAEAKLMESGVMLPSSANGGNYAISRVVPYTVTPTLWGQDSDRFHQVIVLAGNQNPLTPAERDELKALWKAAESASAYETAAKDYLAKKGYTTTDEYTIGYSDDPTIWDATASYQSVDGEAIVNTYDGLMEYDIKGNQIPALATGYTVSEDGKTYTFTIREGVEWVNSQGTKLGVQVTAQDFVNGMRHMLDAQAGLEYLVQGIIVNATEYIEGDVTDFSQVGVKAEGNKLIYTLENPCPYFVTMLGYSVFAPICTSYFTAKGGVFGVAEFAAASADESYTYGTAPENIAYCGPYIVSSFVKTNTIVFESNPFYWNKDNINIKKIVWKFSDGTDATWAYTNMKDGILASSGLNATALQQAKTDKVTGSDKSWFETYGYVSGLDASSYPVFFNLHREGYANFNDATAVVSTMTEDQKTRANIAMQNQNFRLALAFSIDRGAYNATTVGDELKYNSVVNSYTPGNYVKLEQDVTVKINGVDTTFKKDTYYGAIMQAQITADGYPITVWDPTREGGIGASTGFDGWYNVENATKYLNYAIEDLASVGVVVTAENPIVLELPYYDISTTYSNRANALKQSVETVTGGKIIISLVKTGGSNAKNWYYSGYYPQTGDKMNYNLVDVCGWGPDYGDPATYLDTMLPQGGGMAKNIGLY